MAINSILPLLEFVILCRIRYIVTKAEAGAAVYHEDMPKGKYAGIAVAGIAATAASVAESILFVAASLRSFFNKFTSTTFFTWLPVQYTFSEGKDYE